MSLSSLSSTEQKIEEVKPDDVAAPPLPPPLSTIPGLYHTAYHPTSYAAAGFVSSAAAPASFYPGEVTGAAAHDPYAWRHAAAAAAATSYPYPVHQVYLGHPAHAVHAAAEVMANFAHAQRVAAAAAAVQQQYSTYGQPQGKTEGAEDDPHAPTINSVVQKVTQELKAILKRDFNKKMVENTAFTRFETWYVPTQLII